MKRVFALFNIVGQCVAVISKQDESAISKAISDSQGAVESKVTITDLSGWTQVRATVYFEGRSEKQFFQLQEVDFIEVQEG